MAPGLLLVACQRSSEHDEIPSKDGESRPEQDQTLSAQASIKRDRHAFPVLVGVPPDQEPFRHAILMLGPGANVESMSSVLRISASCREQPRARRCILEAWLARR